VNRWLANIFSGIFNIVNLIVFLGFVVFLVGAWRSPENYALSDSSSAFFIFVALLALYILFIGVVSTLLSINETLQNIETSLIGSEKSKPNKPLPSMPRGKNPTKADDILNSQKEVPDNKTKK
tara:strand:+ start:604 stop:972 length:369 start_codon:yes stop_codon:yes gene_type:complete